MTKSKGNGGGRTNGKGNHFMIEPYSHEPYIGEPFSVVERADLSRNGSRFYRLLKVDHMRCGGQRNGSLMATYAQCIKAGISSRLVKAAIDECVRTGLVAITRPGGRNLPTLYRLTWLPVGPTTSRRKPDNHHRAAAH
jgi:hypothetical protein